MGSRDLYDPFMYALVDCNNFYASCEQVFNPKYQNRPLVVLSNNDGCAIARSKEAKALGIPMGAPAFKYQSLFLQHDVIVLSSNYTLYGDMSHRVIQTLKSFSLPTEIYSIDEAFLILPEEGACEIAQAIRKRVKQWTGITVSIGIAPTKTLAKVANHAAKKGRGVVEYSPPLLNHLPLDEVWGIGKRLAKRLYSHRIRYAHELIEQDDSWIRKHLTVVGLRTVLELRGTPCLECHEISPERKTIVSSRSFGKEISTLTEMKEAIGSFIATAAEKLRKEKLKAHFLVVFIHTNRFKEAPFSRSAAAHLPLATASTPELMDHAHLLLESIYREGLFYKKGGILLGELCSEAEEQPDLFSSKRKDAMKTFDAINTRFGEKVLSFAGEGLQKKWKTTCKKRSPKYTTCWDDLLEVKLTHR